MITEDAINNVLEKDIKIIVDGMLSTFPTQPIAIFLVGGYGRGEGAWLEDHEGNPMPYNDFDLAVVTEHPLDAMRTNKLRKELAAKVNIHWVDIDYYSHKQLSNMNPTIHNVDLLYASRCIYGNTEALNRYKPLDASQIGYSDIVTLYKTRMWTLLGSWTGAFHDLTVDEAIFFRNQMVKASLAVCDFLLVKEHKYQTSYKGRVQSVCELFGNNSMLCKRIKWAIGEKLKPSQQIMPKEEMIQLYTECKDLFLWAASESFGDKWKYYANPELTTAFERRCLKTKVREFIALLRNRKNLRKKSREIFAAQNYVLLAENHGEINNTYLEKASDILLAWGYIKQPVLEWDLLHNIVADARNNI